MKTFKRCLMLMLVVLMLLSLAVPAFAVEVEPYGAIRRCPQCITGIVSIYESRRHAYDEFLLCIHGTVGFDVYAVYEVTIRESCDTCNYSSERIGYERVFKYCVENDRLSLHISVLFSP